MKNIELTYSLGGAIEGAPNAEGVPSHLPALNISQYEEVEVEDTRATFSYREDGAPIDSVKVYEAANGHTTHRCTGEKAPRLRVSCVKASYWNETCNEVLITGITEAMDPAERSAAELNAFSACFSLIEEMVANGCPIHDAPAAEPVVLDDLLAGLTPERMDELFSEVNP